MNNVIVIHESDNVGNAVEDISAGSMAVYSSSGGTNSLEAADDIRFGFKIALKEIPEGSDIIKYGEVIGRAGRTILPGEMVHVHNVEGKRGRGDLRAQP